jgi:hypothetical protein
MPSDAECSNHELSDMTDKFSALLSSNPSHTDDTSRPGSSRPYNLPEDPQTRQARLYMANNGHTSGSVSTRGTKRPADLEADEDYFTREEPDETVPHTSLEGDRSTLASGDAGADPKDERRTNVSLDPDLYLNLRRDRRKRAKRASDMAENTEPAAANYPGHQSQGGS